MNRANTPAYPRKERNTRAKTRLFALHDENRSGTKLVKRFFKAKNGIKASSADEAFRWYANYNPEAPT